MKLSQTRLAEVRRKLPHLHLEFVMGKSIDLPGSDHKPQEHIPPARRAAVTGHVPTPRSMWVF